MWAPLFGLLLGIALGLAFPFTFPLAYTRYVAVAILAALDSVFGGLRGSIEEQFDPVIFITGFFSNALLAAGLTYLGDRLGVEIYYAALFAFGVRIFQNLAVMRRHLVEHFRRRLGANLH
ncbi:MAG TPA: small basic family protein [Firmicutes bacterium]|jgi:small basic protein|uniref:small basic family protein n=1 Tax=Gelria sp. Kuro-4 TaxID=2796927 RepID=UPI0019AF9C4A|nr:small basic family protein [Gelria sp. Kuro-4]MDK2926355.1 hypothetical protein [Bacillota bacterium]BCV24695.1 hypothetical protein kuro4_14680 [Gelria sp. Kuro-4]HHV56997.1 small basic family protein [Bacillota bacterium]